MKRLSSPCDEHKQLPQEVIDNILMRLDVRIAVLLGNEHVKKKLLVRLCLPKLWRSGNQGVLQWLQKYDIKDENISVRYKLNFSHPVRDLVWGIPGYVRPGLVPFTAEEASAARAYLEREAADARVQATEARLRKKARRDIKVKAVTAFRTRNMEI